MIKPLPGENILRSTRAEAMLLIRCRPRYKQAIKILREHSDGLTAHEVALIAHAKRYTKTSTRNNYAPRLTELYSMGVVKVLGKRFDYETERNNAVYTLEDDYINIAIS